MKIAAGELVEPLIRVALALALLSGSVSEIEAQPSKQIFLLGQEIYQVNCSACHGVEGDGNGPAASMFRIRPRDFRTGIYKFRSTPSGSLPTNDDLLGTVVQGLRWTGMIGRADLTDSAGKAAVEYLKGFSSRFANERPAKPVDVPPAPVKTAQLLAQGRKLYSELGCAACHGESGRGDGPSAQGLKDDWGWPSWPSDLTWRPLKRGSDLGGTFLTLVTGLSGTSMPSYADSLDSQQAWALVYYMESMVPPNQRLSLDRTLGEEHQGWMALRMGGMMGHGMMGSGMMRRMPSR